MNSPVNLGDYARARTATPGAKKPDRRDLIAAIDQLRQLHAPIEVCRGCCSRECPGNCDWSDAYDGELLTICAHCCLDGYPHEGKQNYTCLDDHHHGVEEGAARQVCATTAILDQVLGEVL
jgi:hypothetical protein